MSNLLLSGLRGVGFVKSRVTKGDLGFPAYPREWMLITTRGYARHDRNNSSENACYYRFSFAVRDCSDWMRAIRGQLRRVAEPGDSIFDRRRLQF